MVRLEQIAVDDNATVFARAHIKQENVWHKQYQIDNALNIKEILCVYPDQHLTLFKWGEGMRIAQDIAGNLGIGPRKDPRYGRNEGDDGNDGNGGGDDNDDGSKTYRWFYYPHVDNFDGGEEWDDGDDNCIEEDGMTMKIAMLIIAVK